MNRIQFVITTALAGLGLLLLAAQVTLQGANRELRSGVETRGQYLQQSAQLEGLYRDIVRALAELGARSNDQQLRAMLEKHGISYTVNASSTPGVAAASRK